MESVLTLKKATYTCGLLQLPAPLVLGGLATGNATSFRAVLQAIESGELAAKAPILISSKPDAPALEFARTHRLRALHISAASEGSREAADEKIFKELMSIHPYCLVMGVKVCMAFMYPVQCLLQEKK